MLFSINIKSMSMHFISSSLKSFPLFAQGHFAQTFERNDFKKKFFEKQKSIMFTF